MTGPAEFLLARVNVAKTVARHVHRLDCASLPNGRGLASSCDCGTPEQIGAGCEAIRCIVIWAERLTAELGVEMWQTPAWEPLCALASIYARHPDYRSEWPLFTTDDTDLAQTIIANGLPTGTPFRESGP